VAFVVSLRGKLRVTRDKLIADHPNVDVLRELLRLDDWFGELCWDYKDKEFNTTPHALTPPEWEIMREHCGEFFQPMGKAYPESGIRKYLHGQGLTLPED
jgi:hypothetical protein